MGVCGLLYGGLFVCKKHAFISLEIVYVGCAKSNFCTSNIVGVETAKMSYGNREMHKATCADCGKECDVPFKPDGTRPVYCRECYAKRRPPRRY